MGIKMNESGGAWRQLKLIQNQAYRGLASNRRFLFHTYIIHHVFHTYLLNWSETCSNVSMGHGTHCTHSLFFGASSGSLYFFPVALVAV